ncbi:hypothetical protein [Janibacter anophelis]|uniref:hypothetical protein n=2 Tax=Janibacter anophelis TaxID=319054 RepID=UPI000A582D1D|nr:hypothetical protein [Janibacter anophelis]
MTDMQEQSRLITEVARSLVAVAPEGWTGIDYTTHMLRGQQQARLWIDTSEGRKGAFSGDDTMPLMRELRAAMYEPGKGTFYTANFVVTAADGSVRTDFEYDAEPDWDMVPGQYLVDLEAFPRDEEHRPEWLRARIAEANAPVVPEVDSRPDPELVAIAEEMFARMPGGEGPLTSRELREGLGVLVTRQSRGGGKLFVATDRSVMFSSSAESVEQGFERFLAGERYRPSPQQ